MGYITLKVTHLATQKSHCTAKSSPSSILVSQIMPTGKKSLLLFSGYHWFACTLTTSQTTTTFQPSKWLWRLEGAGVNWCFSWELTSFSLKIFWLKYLSYYTSTIRNQYILLLVIRATNGKKPKRESLIKRYQSQNVLMKIIFLTFSHKSWFHT